jgi:GNAT superfamily N-acetyltransferase
LSPRPASQNRPDLNGYTELPPGKIAAVATYLDITEPREAPDAASGPAFALEPIGHDLARYRALYRSVGGRWLWFSRAAMPDPELSAIVAHPAVEALAIVAEGRDVGIAELDGRKTPECELAFFGLVPDAFGRGLGRAAIAAVIARAFARPIGRLWLHTCTLDHPGALRFYVRAGFRPYRRAVEIADDPRLTGRLPREAAPDVPLL